MATEYQYLYIYVYIYISSDSTIGHSKRMDGRYPLAITRLTELIRLLIWLVVWNIFFVSI